MFNPVKYENVNKCIRLDKRLYEQVQNMADSRSMSFNALVIEMIKYSLANAKNEGEGADT